ncbi:hypothetical protein FGB62_1g657 [Gracilaria domingensis]|nr:hypothetical protein FGB62_1g657 [Gracilaria domingensis]
MVLAARLLRWLFGSRDHDPVHATETDELAHGDCGGVRAVRIKSGRKRHKAALPVGTSAVGMQRRNGNYADALIVPVLDLEAVHLDRDVEEQATDIGLMPLRRRRGPAAGGAPLARGGRGVRVAVLGSGDEMDVLEVDLDGGGGERRPRDVDAETAGASLVDVEGDMRTIERIGAQLHVIDNQPPASKPDAHVGRRQLGIATGDGLQQRRESVLQHGGRGRPSREEGGGGAARLRSGAVSWRDGAPRRARRRAVRRETRDAR